MVVVGVHIDVPQRQLVQLSNHFLHGILVLVDCTIDGTGAGLGTRNLGVGEVEQAHIGNDLVLVGSCQG